MSRFFAAVRFVIETVCAVACLLLLIVASVAAERSSEWRAVRNAHVLKHPTCEACGSFESPEAHHVKPVSLYPGPENELDPSNLITLCPRCHLLIGHLGNTRAHNPLVREDAARMLARVKARPYTKEAGEAFQRRFALAP